MINEDNNMMNKVQWQINFILFSSTQSKHSVGDVVVGDGVVGVVGEEDGVADGADVVHVGDVTVGSNVNICVYWHESLWGHVWFNVIILAQNIPYEHEFDPKHSIFTDPSEQIFNHEQTWLPIHSTSIIDVTSANIPKLRQLLYTTPLLHKIST